MTISEAFSLAAAHFARGELAEAENLSRQILAADPNHAQAWRLLGMIALHAASYRPAAEALARAVALDPQNAQAHNYLGVALHGQGRLAEAIECYRRAISLDPGNAEAHSHLGNALGDRGQPAEAIACYTRALEIAPDYVEAYVNCGATYALEKKYDEAVACYRRALELRPDMAEIYGNLGGVLQKQQHLDEAHACLCRALERKPDVPEYLVNLGHVYKSQGKLAEALAVYRRALALRPAYGDAHFGIALILLTLGDFAGGWPAYEWRWKTASGIRPRHTHRPQWQGEPLGGKTILVYADQGFGDTFQFVRYLPLVQARGGRVVFQCQAGLTRILSPSRGFDELVAEGDPLPSFDYQVPLASLLGIFRTSLETIPAAVPYVFAEPALVAHWQESLAGHRGFRIGINWRGREGVGDFRIRDIPLEQFAPLAAIPGVRLISLQKGGSPELAQIEFPVIDFPERDTVHGPFVDTAAIMKNLDLVITSDTSIAHLAGALGVPVWVALPSAADWRWFLSRSDSPWYPTMRLFRQKQRGNWNDVITAIRTALEKRG